MGHQGENHSDFDRVCGGCQSRCKPFLPDNITLVPICPKCWGSLNTVQRMMILAEMKQAKELGDIASMIGESIRHSDLLSGRRFNEGN